MQILKMLTVEQINYFNDLFEDLSEEIDVLGWKGSEPELINQMLQSHFMIEMEDERQLNMLTNCLLSNKYKAAINIELLKRKAA
jgi:hypothetical protein